MAISRVKKWLIITGILLMYFFACACFLYSHYVWDGRYCAELLFYAPLSLSDRFIFLLFGGITGFVIWYFGRCKGVFSKMTTLLLIALCILTSTILGLYGNDILGSRTEHWPHEYHPTPISSYNAPKHYEDLFYGTWIYHHGQLESDFFLADTIFFDVNNIYSNYDNKYAYTYSLQNDSLYIHRPNRGVQVFKISLMTDKFLILKLIGEDDFDALEVPQVLYKTTEVYYSKPQN